MSTTALKLLALALMLLDHIAQFLPDIPIWFHWLGRISAPLFIFCTIWGYYYTHSRKHYLLRLYLFGAGMAVSNLILNNVLINPNSIISNNVFVTLFLTCILISLIDPSHPSFKLEAAISKNKVLAWIIFIISQFFIMLLCGILTNFIPLKSMPLFVGAILPSIIFNEGSFLFPSLGAYLYFTREKPKAFIVGYTFFSLLFLLLNGDFSFESLFIRNYQWMMVASLPFMLIYNHKKGAGLKYLFYIFYPAHIIILYIAGCFL